jgi:hypothetical protein
MMESDEKKHVRVSVTQKVEWAVAETIEAERVTAMPKR